MAKGTKSAKAGTLKADKEYPKKPMVKPGMSGKPRGNKAPPFGKGKDGK